MMIGRTSASEIKDGQRRRTIRCTDEGSGRTCWTMPSSMRNILPVFSSGISSWSAVVLSPTGYTPSWCGLKRSVKLMYVPLFA